MIGNINRGTHCLGGLVIRFIFDRESNGDYSLRETFRFVSWKL